MAASPPPYSPRDAKQQAREYARAQKAQWRAQRQYWRYWRGYRRPSLVGPCILLAIGTLALLLETGTLDRVSFWNWYAHWWPLLLIGIGLLSLGEHFLDRNSAYPTRRSFVGVFWLVILLVSFGFVSRHGHMVGPWAWQFDGDNDGFSSWMGEEHDNDVEIDQVLTAEKPSVAIQNPRGDVTITASSDGKMHVRAHQMVHVSTEKDAQRIFGEVRPKIEASAGGAVISVPGRDDSSVDLTVELPSQSFTTVTANHGDVTMEGLTGNADVTDDRGDVKFDDIGGDVHARMNHGDFSAHNIGGHAFVDGHGEDVTLSEIKGQASISGEFFGDVHLEQIGSTVHFHSSQTEVEIPRLLGVLTLDKSDLNISQASGPVRVVARSKDIDLSGVSGDVHIEDSDGDISVAAAPPLGNVQIRNRTGAVTFNVPENVSFSVTGSTSSDQDLQTDFPLRIETDGGRRTIEGQIGQGGPKIDLVTDHGSLQLKKGSAELTVPTPPEPPAPPKHLRERPEPPERPELTEQ